MHHFFEAITNTAGDSLIGYFGRVINRTTQNTVTLSSDENGTPIVVVSGVENMAKTDENGNLSLYVEPGTYHLDIYAPNTTSRLYQVRDVAMNSTKGDPGPPGEQGETGADGEGLAEVMAPTGAALVGARQSSLEPADQKQADINAETVSVMRYIPIAERAAIRAGTSTYDCTAAFNLATSAATAPYVSNNNAIFRNVIIPNGRYVINGTVYVRRAQSLIGQSYSGVVIDLQGNPGTAFKLGQAAGGVDLGGYGVTVQNILTYGGAASFPVFDASSPDSWKIISCMITEAGIGIRAGGTDGKIVDCIIDGGLTGIDFIATSPFKCHGIICTLNKFFNPVNAIRVRDGAADLLITGNLIQFAEVSSLEVAGNNIRNIQFTNNLVVANGQFESHLGGVFLNNCPAADLIVSENNFRNLKGLALSYGGGLGIKLAFTGNKVDGNRSEGVYDQSTTAGGLEVSNMDAVVSGNVFRNLRGPTVFCAPSTATNVRLIGNTFAGNTGGSTEVQLIGSNGSTTVTVDPSNYSDRAIIPAQSGIAVQARNVARGRATLVGGQVVIAEPLTRTSSRVLVQRYADGGTVAASYSVSRNAGTGFTIQAKDGAGANQALDTSTVDWSMDLIGL